MARPKRTWRRRIARLARFLLGGVAALLALVVIAVLVLGHTEWGHRALLHRLLPVIEASLKGHLRVGRLDGDLVSGIVIDELAVEDEEGHAVLAVRRLAARYRLLPLVHRTLEVEEVSAEGVVVDARLRADGQLNLAALVRPSPPSPPSDKPFVVRVHRLTLDAAASYALPSVKPPRAPLPVERVAVKLDLAGSAAIEGDRISVTVDALKVIASEPLPATLVTGGGFVLGVGAGAVDGFHCTVRAEGDALQRLLPDAGPGGARLLGSWQVDLGARGPLTNLEVSVEARPPKGVIAVSGTLDATTLRWRGAVKARDLDPGAAWSGAPHGHLAFDAAGDGTAGRGALALSHLDVAVTGARASAHGRFSFDGDVDAHVELDAPDLAGLRHLEVPGMAKLPPLAGALSLRVHGVRAGESLRVNGTVKGSQLVLPGARIAELHVEANGDARLSGGLRADAHGVETGGPALGDLSLHATATEGVASIEVSANATDGSSLSLAARGAPRWRGGRPVGADATLESLLLKARGREVRLDGPAHLEVGDEARVAGLALVSGTQRVQLDGRYHLASGVADLVARLQGIDAKELAAVAALSTPLPRTRIDADVHVTGRAGAPVVDLALRGVSEAHPPFELDRSEHALTAHYAAGRVAGDLTVTSEGPRMRARFDVPVSLRDLRPLDADVHFDVPAIERFRRFLPARVAALRGAATVELKLAGTPREPDVSATVSVPSWELDAFRRSAAGVKLVWKDGRIDVRGDLTLALGEGDGIGELGLSLGAPLRVDLTAIPPDLGASLLQSTPIEASARIEKLDAGRFPFTTFAVSDPLTTGRVDGTVRVAGTAVDPTVTVELAARNLATPALTRPLDASVRATYRRGAVDLAAEVSQGGRRAVALHGTSAIDVFAIAPWKTLPVSLDVTMTRLDLANLPDTDGLIDGTVKVRGTLGQADSDLALTLAHVHADDLDLGDLSLGGHASFDGAAAHARIDLRQAHGGSLGVDAAAPLIAKAPWKLAFSSKAFDLAFLGAAVPAVKRVVAKLDADLTIGGSRAAPTLDGFARIDNGLVEMDNQPFPYQGIQLDAVAKDGGFSLKRFAVSYEKGTLATTLNGRLDGLRPISVSGGMEAKHFPIAVGDMMVTLDTSVAMEAADKDGVLGGAVTLREGALHLPKLEGTRSAQSLAPLKDVKFVTARDRKTSRVTTGKDTSETPTASATDGPATRMKLVAHMPGPFYVHGPEVNSELSGDLDVSIVGSEVRITGTVDVLRGAIQIAERPYTIEKATASFDGGPDLDPTLEVSITRDIEGAQIVIQIDGTASAPKLTISCDPPIYDQTQLILMIASGDTAPTPQSDNENKPIGDQIEQKVIGAVSGLLLGKIKDELGSFLPIEVLKVDLGYQGYSEIPRARLEVGKYLLDNLYLSYVYQYAPQTSQRKQNNHEGHLEYSFHRDFSLMTTFGDAAVGAIDLYWNRRF